MPRRHPRRFATPPVDPRARDVVAWLQSGRFYALDLSCGHTIKRILMCRPSRAICTLCPAAGGIAGNLHDGRRERIEQE